MKLYNTLSHKIEEFIPWNEELVTMYTCGPTVYHYAHIGNLRTYIAEDILEKSLLYLDYKVKRCMNITDVGHLSSDADTGEDKMVLSAKNNNKSVLEIASFYTNAFFNDFTKLNIKKPEIISPATQNIDEYIKIIATLLEKEYAYISGGNVYFDTSKLDNYYILTNQQKDELLEGVRESVEIDNNKKNKNDFVLWFTKSKFDTQELKWMSPFGEGYPGWHIECSGISLKYLGEFLDIHCGGVDNIFPHHTNEIAQSVGYLGHPWCNYWVHAEHLNDDTGKMSKSKGKTLTISVLEEEGYNPLSYRFMCLLSHYRKQLTFSYETLAGIDNAYNKLKKKCLNLVNDELINEEEFNKYNNIFKDYIADDLNTANAITLIYDVLKSTINDSTKYKLIASFDKVLSLDLLKKTDKLIDKEYILKKINERNEAKKNKNFEIADNIRKELNDQGIILKDTKDETLYEVK